MNILPWPDMLNFAIILAISIPLLGIVGLPIMIIAGQTTSIMRSRSAYAKCAKQIAKLTLILAWPLTLVTLILLWLRIGQSLITLFSEQGLGLAWQKLISLSPDLVYTQAHIVVALTMLVASIFMSIVYASWATWEQKRILLQCLALVSSFWYGLSIYCILCIISAEDAALIGITFPTSLALLFEPSIESNFWNVAPYLPPLAFALAAGLACIWLMLRRSIDDFGRDYYASMLKWCAAWGRSAWLILWAFLVGTTAMQWINSLQSPDFLSSPDFIQGAAFILLWLIPGILWTIPTRSNTPLRHKMTVVVAFFLSVGIIIPLYMSFKGF